MELWCPWRLDKYCGMNHSWPHFDTSIWKTILGARGVDNSKKGCEIYVDVTKQKVWVRVVVIGIAVTVVIQVILVYILPQIGFNPLRIAPFPAQ